MSSDPSQRFKSSAMPRETYSRGEWVERANRAKTEEQCEDVNRHLFPMMWRAGAEWLMADAAQELLLRTSAIDAIQLSEAARNEVRARVRRILQFDLAALANAGWFSDAWPTPPVQGSSDRLTFFSAHLRLLPQAALGDMRSRDR